MVSIARLRSYLSQILHLHESPHRTALAFAIGVFIAFSPIYGLHTLSVVFCTWAFRLNFLALMVGAGINNPWTLVPILGATIWTGSKLLGIPQASPFDWDNLSLLSLYDQVLPYALPFAAGGVFDYGVREVIRFGHGPMMPGPTVPPRRASNDNPVKRCT